MSLVCCPLSCCCLRLCSSIVFFNSFAATDTSLVPMFHSTLSWYCLCLRNKFCKQKFSFGNWVARKTMRPGWFRPFRRRDLTNTAEPSGVRAMFLCNSGTTQWDSPTYASFKPAGSSLHRIGQDLGFVNRSEPKFIDKRFVLKSTLYSQY